MDEPPPVTNSSVAESDSESEKSSRPRKKRRVVQLANNDEEDVPLPDYQAHDISPPIQEPNGRQRPLSRPRNRSRSTERQSQHSQEESEPTKASKSPEVTHGHSFQKSKGNYPSQTPQRQKASSTLRPVPQISPTVFRERMEPPLSQIEQFSTPGSSRRRPKYSSGDATGSRGQVEPGPEEIQPEPEMENTYVSTDNEVTRAFLRNISSRI
jgi:hypothetical protein